MTSKDTDAAPEAHEESDEQLVEADLDALLADVTRERDEYLELAQRTKADFENFRKRVTREAAEAERRGTANLARGLIPTLDNLELALASAGLDPAGDPPEGGLEHGVLLVYRELRGTLERAGVEGYDPAGEAFDPAWHEAVSSRPATDGEQGGCVVEVVQRGYRHEGQVLRPARVVVTA